MNSMRRPFIRPSRPMTRTGRMPSGNSTSSVTLLAATLSTSPSSFAKIVGRSSPVAAKYALPSLCPESFVIRSSL